MNPSLKQLALKNIESAMTRFGCLGTEEMKYSRTTKPDMSDAQIFSLPQIKVEIENGTELGERFVLAMAVDPCKSEAENRRILKEFLPIM